MIYIAHRALTHGPDKSKENSPMQIQDALSQGFDCEIDVWMVDNKWYLGHDEPTYEVPLVYLNNPRFWIHAKNLCALDALSEIDLASDLFWHQEDDYVLTKKRYLWTYPGKTLTRNSICVMPEWNYDISEFNLSCYGVCSDFVGIMNKKVD